ncbi:response regulator transcription factor [soil metagenome]
MAYLKFHPAPALQQYVMFYYILEYEHILEKSLILHSPPKGLGGMVINFSDPYYTTNKNGEWEKVSDHFIAGQFTENYTLQLQGKVGMVGVVFFPNAIPNLLNIPMSEFTDQRIDISLVLGENSNILTEQIISAETHEGRIEILEQYLLDIFCKSNASIDIVDYALSMIMKNNGNISIEDLSDHLCISMRHFRRRFTEKIGLSPKFYARIKRFNHIMHLSETSPANWADLVFRGGYYDQAHFIHDFHSLSGKSPSEFFNYNRHLAQVVGA